MPARVDKILDKWTATVTMLSAHAHTTGLVFQQSLKWIQFNKLSCQTECSLARSSARPPLHTTQNMIRDMTTR